jgi:hypothetical protein
MRTTSGRQLLPGDPDLWRDLIGYLVARVVGERHRGRAWKCSSRKHTERLGHRDERSDGAPEIDGNSALNALTLLFGTLAVLRSHYKTKQETLEKATATSSRWG